MIIGGNVAKRKELPSLEYLKNIFYYDGANLCYRNTSLACRCPMSKDVIYFVVTIEFERYLVHRIIWKIFYEEEPPNEIDHEDNDKQNNSIINLRPATHAQNIYNRLMQGNNTSGYKGVSWHKQREKWRAYIVKDYKQKSLGLYDTPEEAHAAYVVAAEEIAKEYANDG